MSDRLVTVTAYADGEDADAAKGVLDTAGIESVIDGAVERRVKVRVENVHAIRAGDVLTENGTAPSEIDEPDEDLPDSACPACGSPEIASSRRGQTFALVATLAVAVGVGIGIVEATFFAIIATAVFLLIRGRWRCTACGETFD